MDLSESYTLLELEAGATVDDARHAYKRQVKIWHPDRFSADCLLKGQAEERIKTINLAYEQVRRYLLQTKPVLASAGFSSPSTSPRTPLYETLKISGRILRQYGRQLLDALAPAIRDMVSGTSGRASDQTTKAMGRRHDKSFSNLPKDAGLIIAGQESAWQPGRRIRPPHALLNRHGLPRCAGGDRGRVAAIDGIHPCDAPHRVHKVARIASLD
jgi:hypothetical protein